MTFLVIWIALAYGLLPNTSGVRDAREAVLAAELAREALETSWVKLEIHPDPKYLMPDALQTLRATEELVKTRFYRAPLRSRRSGAL